MRYQRVTYQFVASPAPSPRVPALVALGPSAWRPHADVAETPEAFAVVVELAGVHEEDVDILLFENALVVRGSRHHPQRSQDAVFHAAEIRVGRFRLEVQFPRTIRADLVEASLSEGLLHIRLPKAMSGEQAR